MLSRLILYFYNKLQKNKTSDNLKFCRRFGVAAWVSVQAFMLTNISAVFAAPLPDPLPVTPDAGQILQQIERDIEVRPLPKMPEIEEAAPADQDQGPRVVIKQFKFEGNKVLSEAELQAALGELTGREITVTQLRSAADLIAAYYREKGYLATATLPEQDITEGVVVIKIVEATFGGVKFDGEYGKDFKRIRPSVINRVVESSSVKGKALNQADLDRALNVMQKMSGFQVSANYQAGEAENTTDVLMKVKDKPLFSGAFSADNSGGRSTGRDKQTASLGLASPLGFGDSLSITALRSSGTDYASVAYSLPVGGRGLQLGVNSSYLEYTVVLNDAAIAQIKPRGRSVVYGVDLSYPLLVSKKGSINIEANYDKKSFINQSRPDVNVAYLTTSDYQVNVFSLMLSGSYYDSLFAGGVNNASLNFGRGNVDMAGSYDYFKNESHQENDSKAANTQGYFNRLKWNVSRNQFITDSWVLSLEGSGQFADKNLDSSEKFYLGGMNGVRAYPTSEGAGSEGYLFKAELRKYLPYNFNASVFIDDGKVKQYVDASRNDGTGSLLDTNINQPNEYHLRGYGASLAWSGPYNALIKATYSERMGNNPNPSIKDTGVYDQDGALKRRVFWLSGSVAF
jgi:hemolysin activation/secretion protein